MNPLPENLPLLDGIRDRSVLIDSTFHRLLNSARLVVNASIAGMSRRASVLAASRTLRCDCLTPSPFAKASP